MWVFKRDLKTVFREIGILNWVLKFNCDFSELSIRKKTSEAEGKKHDKTMEVVRMYSLL